MLVLVTGGAGYIGSHTVRALTDSGCNVVVLDNLKYGHKKIVESVLKVPLVVGEVGDKALLREIISGKHSSTKGKYVDAIIHFAAYAYVGESVIKPLKYYKNNVAQTLSLLEVILEENDRRLKLGISIKVPIIFSSTCATYGSPDSFPITESTPQNPINPYGQTKLFIERIMLDFWKAYKLPHVIFRYFNAAGADSKGDIGEDHNPETHLIPLAFEALTDPSRPLQIYGNDYPTKDGTCIRDFIHVSDIAHAHLLGLKHVVAEEGSYIYNLGTGKGFSVLEVIRAIEDIAKDNLPVTMTDRRAGDPPILVASSEKIESELGWKPINSKLELIIKDAWRWFNNNN